MSADDETKKALGDLLGDVDKLVQKYRRQYGIDDGTGKRASDGDGGTGKRVHDGTGKRVQDGTGKRMRDGTGKRAKDGGAS